MQIIYNNRLNSIKKMHKPFDIFRFFTITLLALICLSPARAGEESPGVIGEPYTVPTTETYSGDDDYCLNYTGCGGVNVSVMNATYEQEVLDLVNSERASRGIPPLKRVTALDYAARYHSADLGQDNYFSHDSYDRENGSLVFECGTWDRISSFYPSASGENIAGGYNSPKSVMNAWMNSEGHRNNILNSNYKTIGVGYYAVKGSSYYHYWTQDFGHPSNEYPLIINRDAASTGNRDVSIYIYGDFDQMRLKNDDLAWGEWQTFQNSFSWTLRGIAGERAVSAELKSGSNIYTSSDTIILTGDFTPILGNLPGSFTFIYSIPENVLQPTNAVFSPLNINTSDTLTWSISPSGAWFSVSPLSGVTPQTFQVIPDNFDTHSVHTYTGSVIVTVSNPADTENSPHTIAVTLVVIDTPIQKTYLPLVKK